MRLSPFALIAACMITIPLFGQGQVQGQVPAAPFPPGTAIRMGTDVGPMVGGMAGGITIRHEMGEWWKNSEIAKKLQLSDAQITKLNQIFYDHRLKLIDYRAGMEKQDLELQNLLDQDQPDEKQVSTQVDQVLTARGKLEREFTMMNLDLRLVLSVEQWRQLKSIQQERGPADRVFLYRRMGPNTFFEKRGPGAPPLPQLPDPDPDDTF
jgi:Spy/CpxP family protein refolding chaperone